MPRGGHGAEVGVQAQVTRRARRDDQPPERGAGLTRPDRLEQLAAEALALVRRDHHQVGQLLHRPEAHHAHERHRATAVLGDQVAAVGLRVQELDEGAVTAPGLRDVRVGADAAAQVALLDSQSMHRAVGERERREEVAGGALAY